MRTTGRTWRWGALTFSQRCILLLSDCRTQRQSARRGQKQTYTTRWTVRRLKLEQRGCRTAMWGVPKMPAVTADLRLVVGAVNLLLSPLGGSCVC